MRQYTWLNKLGFVCGLFAFAGDVHAHASVGMIAFDLILTAGNLYFVLRDYGTETEEG